MEEFKKSLYEIYMNYDTVQYLKNENQSSEDIVSMFTDELEYSKDLTTTLLTYNKSFLRSIAMRIKLKIKKKIENNIIKQEILSYDKELKPLLEKLLVSSEFKEQYEKMNEIENEEEEEEEEEDKISSELSFIDNKVEKTDDNSNFIKVSELYKHYCSYCDNNNLDRLSKSEFKTFLSNQWGKCTKNGYSEYRLVEE